MPATLTTRPAHAGFAAAVEGLPPPGQLYAMRDVSVFLAGEHHADEPAWTHAELRQIADNFAEVSAGDDPILEVPLVVGHGDFSDEQPAVGFVTDLKYQDPPGSLVADFGGIDAETAESIRSRRLYSLSIELVPAPPGVPVTGHVLKRVALLGGGSTPAVKGLGRLPVPTRDRRRRVAAFCCPVPFGAGVFLFADTSSRKVRTMTATQLRTSRFDEATDQAVLDKLNPLWSSLAAAVHDFLVARGADPTLVDTWLQNAPTMTAAPTAAFSEKLALQRLDALTPGTAAFYDEIRRQALARYHAGRPRTDPADIQRRLGRY